MELGGRRCTRKKVRTFRGKLTADIGIIQECFFQMLQRIDILFLHLIDTRANKQTAKLIWDR